MTILEFIESSLIPPAVIAAKMGMKRGTFHNKLKGNNGASFTPDETEMIKTILQGIANKINQGIKEVK